jgi:hypothetical protein
VERAFDMMIEISVKLEAGVNVLVIYGNEFLTDGSGILWF